MSDVIDFSTLKWVKSELDETLKKARQALEAYVENPQDEAQLAELAVNLHQVYGTLQMVELYGAAMLAEEMEQVANALSQEKISQRDDVYEVLMGAILQLPDYLDRLVAGHRDIPLVLLPLLNDLRALRGENLVSEGSLFSPDLTQPMPNDIAMAHVEGDIQRRARELRHRFQLGLLGVFRDEDVEGSLASLEEITRTMIGLSGRPEARRFWWISTGVIEALKEQSLQSTAAVKQLLGRMDRVLRKLIDEGEDALSASGLDDLSKSLLFYAGRANTENAYVAEIQAIYQLDALLPRQDEIAAAQESLTGQNTDLFKTVAAVVKEELSHLKEGLDGVIRNSSGKADELKTIAAGLRSMSDTLGMIGLGAQRKAILNKAGELQGFVDRDEAPSETVLMDVASTLLLVDSAMERMSQGHTVSTSEETDDAEQSLADAEFDQVKEVVLNEAISDLVRAKEAVVGFMEEQQSGLLEEAKQLLSQVKGGLLLLDETRASTLIGNTARYIQRKMLDAEQMPPEKELESLADAICGVEYYLEGLRESRAFSDSAINVAEQSVAELGYDADTEDEEQDVPGVVPDLSSAQVADDESGFSFEFIETEAADRTVDESGQAENEEPPAADVPVAAADEPDASEADARAVSVDSGSGSRHDYDAEMSEYPILGEETDEEILEIFIEEAEEEMASIEENLANWAGDPNDSEALATMRRSFHTLKGSGRLIGAMRIGEFAWAFESLLNRVIDKTVEQSDAMLDILHQAHEALPTLVEQIKQGSKLDKPVAWLMACAEALSAGEVLPERTDIDLDTRVETEAAVADEEQLPLVQEADVADATGMDPVLYDIYQTETKGHFATVDAFLGASENKASDELVRALHTLHGSANTASVESIAAVSARLEKYFKMLAEAGQPVPEAGFDALSQGRIIMGALFDQLPGAVVEPEGLPDYLQYMDDLLASTEADIEAITAAQSAEEAERADMAGEAEIAVAAPNPYADQDQELLQIFLEESSEILERSDAAMSAWRHDPADMAAVEQLQRELHTLKGGARMAELDPIGDLAHALESTITRLVESGAMADADMLGSIQSGHDYLSSQVELVRRKQPLEDMSSLIEHLQNCEAQAAALSVAPAESDETASADYGGDPELVEIFIEEASDILEGSDGLLQQWKSEPDNTELMSALQRELHTLKGGARMADITEIGDLAHSVESLMVVLAEGEIQPSPALFGVLEQAHDRLVTMVISVRDREPLQSSADLQQQLEALRNGEAVTDVAIEAPASKKAPGKAAPANRSDKIERRARPRETAELVRVRADLLDELVNNAGEVSIYRSRLEQQVGAYRFNLVEMEQTILRLREQLRKLEIETEAQILFRYEKEIDETSGDFDPLEMDRYSNLQQLSRSLMESVADLGSIQNLLENTTRESETLLLQQSRVNTDLQEGLMRTRMVPFLGLAPRMRRIVRQTSQELGKKTELELSGAEGELDRTVIDRIIAPVEHMLRNAISHGIETPEQRVAAGKPETGTIHISFERESSDIVLTIADDGAGISLEKVRQKAIERGLMDADSNLSDNEVLQFILETGFSTAGQVTQVSGRGVGMDVVSSEVKQLGGALHIDSVEGQGTTFTIRLPFSLAINQALLVEVGEDSYAVPLSSIQGIVRMERQQLEQYYADPSSSYTYNGLDYEVRHLGSLLGTHKPNLGALSDRVPVLLARTGDITVALQVDNLTGSREIVVKSVGPQISAVRGVSGATILGDGRVVMILDVASLLRSGVSGMAQIEEMFQQQPVKAEGLTVMVVDDSITVRKVTSRLLERNDMTVVTAKDGVDAVAKLHETVPDIMLLDIEMPRMDGFELATHIRNEPRLQHVPIIMITSRTGDKHRQRAMEIGVNRYLGKPFQEAELLASIREVLEDQ